jgi:hypothetical protein
VGGKRQWAAVKVPQQVPVESTIEGGQCSSAKRESRKGGRGPPGCEDEGSGLLQRGQGIYEGQLMCAQTGVLKPGQKGTVEKGAVEKGAVEKGQVADTAGGGGKRWNKARSSCRRQWREMHNWEIDTGHRPLRPSTLYTLYMMYLLEFG